MNYRFHPAAEQEYLAQIEYYEQRQAGLGARYIESIEATITDVCTHPARFQSLDTPGTRIAHVPAFPFFIVFRSVSGATQILAVSHYRRRPLYWSVRLISEPPSPHYWPLAVNVDALLPKHSPGSLAPDFPRHCPTA